jgi:hypothetical protein
MKGPLLLCRLGIALGIFSRCGSALALCATNVYYGLVHCVDDGKETEVDSDTCADPGPANWFCVQGYGQCTDGTPFYTANAGCSDSCGDGCYDGGGGGCDKDQCPCDDGSCSGVCCSDSRSRGSNTVPRLLSSSGGYYRSGRVFDDRLFGVYDSRRPICLTAVPHSAYASFEKGISLEVKP